ncbi:MAG: site-specific integrase, partial [Gilvibacter sp.]
ADDYCKSLRKVMIADVDTDNVLEVLKPIWGSKNETASRIRGRIEKVLDFAKVKGWRSSDNPSRWTGNLEHVLSKRKKLQRGHHASMPHGEVSEFYKTIVIDLSAGAACLAWTILNAVRSGEARRAEWSEIDTEARLWVIPPERMKMKKEHRVPLSDAAVAVLEARREYEGDGLIFAGKGGKALSDMTLAGHLKRRELPYTVHGFRSSFRDWAAEQSGHSFDVIETALAHKVGSAVAQAYMRSDLLDKRRDLMDQWGGYVLECKHHPESPLVAQSRSVSIGGNGIRT